MNKSNSFKRPALMIVTLTMTSFSLIITWYIELLAKEIFLLALY